MPEGIKSNKEIQDEIVEKALKTGNLSGVGINHFENHTREELLAHGYNEAQLECAIRVLAHFDTSLGARLGRCPRELWAVRPCADCGIKVDTHEQNFLPKYADYLCKECVDNRDAKKKCSECDSLYDDSAIENDSRRCRQKYIAKDTWEYLCNFCAISAGSGSSDFLKNRGGYDLDFHNLKRLIDDFGLTEREGKAYFPNGEEVEWFYDKALVGMTKKDKKKYFISYTGFVVQTFSEPTELDPNDRRNWMHWLIWHPKDPCKLVQIARVRVRCKDSLAYLEFIYTDAFHPTMDIRNAQNVENFDKLKEVWAGLKLMRSIEERSPGRPLGSGWFDSTESFCSALRDTLNDFQQKPKQLEVVRLLDKHPLCKLKPKNPRSYSDTKALRNWLSKAEIPSFDEAWSLYGYPSRLGRN